MSEVIHLLGWSAKRADGRRLHADGDEVEWRADGLPTVFERKADARAAMANLPACEVEWEPWARMVYFKTRGERK